MKNLNEIKKEVIMNTTGFNSIQVHQINPEYTEFGVVAITSEGNPIVFRGFSKKEVICMLEYMQKSQDLIFSRTLHGTGWFNIPANMQEEYSEKNIEEGKCLLNKYIPTILKFHWGFSNS